MPLTFRLSLLSSLLWTSFSIAAPASPSCTKEEQQPAIATASSQVAQPTYKATTRAIATSPEAIGGSYTTFGRGLDRPLQQNGTWIDVNIWDTRPDILSKPPFLFTLSPGRTSSTHTIHQLSLDPATPGAKLAYTQGDADLPVNYGSTAAFILTDGETNDKQVVDNWTIGKDAAGRTVLGMAEWKESKVWGALGGSEWTLAGCYWNSEGVDQLCDGFVLINPPAGFGAGTGVVLELEEWEG